MHHIGMSIDIATDLDLLLMVESINTEERLTI